MLAQVITASRQKLETRLWKVIRPFLGASSSTMRKRGKCRPDTEVHTFQVVVPTLKPTCLVLVRADDSA